MSRRALPVVLFAASAAVLLWGITDKLDHARAHAPAPSPPAQIEQALDLPPEPDGSDVFMRLTPDSLRLAYAGRAGLTARPRETPDNCSRFISQVVSDAGIPMHGRVSRLWARAKELGAVHYNPVPFVGDLVFFNNTYDANHDGRWNDPYSHIALVVDVAPDGTIEMVHRGGRRELIQMNLFRPHDYKDEDGRVLNSYLRSHHSGDPKWAMYRSGQLWSGFATLAEGQDWRVPEDWEVAE